MEDLRVAAVAMRSPVGDKAGNLARMGWFARQAAGQGAQVICFPELNITGYRVGPGAAASSEPAARRSRYQRALALQLRSWVAKSTRTSPKRAR